jgi:hypothetical protein
VLSGSLDESAEILDESLQSNSGCKVASPEGMFSISVGEEIISFDRICGFLLLNGCDVVARS